jgi:NAD(P)-dependent dehydrogenase (short-subunit alcohol dehydrogenase family)
VSALENRSFLVTGSLGGMGLAIAEALLAAGARVFMSHRPGCAAPVPPAADSRTQAIELDVTSERDWVRAIETIVAASGALHGLVNNAGVLAAAAEFTDVSLAQWRRTLRVNLDGSFMGCRLAMRAMASTGGGAIVNISSGAAHIAVPDAAAYCVSKAAGLALTRVAARAGGPHRVRVNAILPGAVDTPMLWRNLRPGGSAAQLLAALTALHPIGRIGTPADVAAAVVFLCDPANSFITGAELAVDGGQLAA